MSHDPSTQLRMTVLGPPQITRADGATLALRSRKHVALLIYLAIEQRHVSSRDTLLALLWPEADEEAARNSLRVALASLRRELGEGARLFLITRHTVQFNAQSDHMLDVLAFRALLDASQKHRHDSLDTCTTCIARLEQAVALYSGEFLHGFVLPDSSAFEEWMLLQREQLHQSALEALHLLAQAYERLGDHTTQCRYARRQIELEPWREQAHIQLMRGLLASGQRGAALEQYHACRRILATELGLSPSPEVTELYEQLRAEAPSDSDLPVMPAELPTSETNTQHSTLNTHHLNTLPTPLTPFVGRATELTELTELLHDAETRLLTIVGAGGMGKTRLALELARINGGDYADGVCFVALASLRAADELPAALLHALDLSSLGGDPAAVLVHTLHDKHMLLVLDNFEQILDGAALVVELLQAAPRLQVVATSRERLNVRGEQRYLVAGLTYTSDAPDADIAALPAVRLFMQSARRIHSRFHLDTDDLASVLRICQLTLGMPLGLELAAVWVELLPPATIAAQIERRGDFLSAEVRDLPERQRSMRAVFDWSWRLLRADEQQVFSQLSVFRGGFTLEAAQAVADAALPMMRQLVEKSLVQVGAGRYQIHELLRQFAAEHLDAAHERAATEQRHSQFFLAFVAQRELRLARHDPLQATVEIQDEIDNIRTAWAWATSHAALDQLDTCAWGLWQYHKLTGVSPDAEHVWRLAAERVQTQREHTHADDQVRQRTERVVSKLLALHAFALVERGAYRESVVVASRAIRLAQASGSVEGEVIGCFVRGATQYRQGHYLPASTELQHTLELLAIYTHDHPTYESFGVIEWMAHTFLAAINFRLGNYSATRDHCINGLQLCQAQGRRFGEASCLYNLADVAREVRELASARRSYEQALRLSTSVGYRRGEGLSLLELGDVMRLQGEYALALDTTERAHAMLREIGDVLETARAAAYLGRLYGYLGDYAHAHEWFDEFSHNASIAGSPEMVVDGLIPRVILALQTGDAKQALVDAEQAWALAQAFSSPYGQAAALVVLGRAQAALELPAAAESYRQALSFYEGLGNPPLAAEPRAGLAMLALAGGDRDGALRHAEVLVSILAEHPRAGLDEPFGVYLACHRILVATSDPRAEALFQQAQQLLEDYAEHIFDDALRQSFLEVATHREFVRRSE